MLLSHGRSGVRANLKSYQNFLWIFLLFHYIDNLLTINFLSFQIVEMRPFWNEFLPHCGVSQMSIFCCLQKIDGPLICIMVGFQSRGRKQLNLSIFRSKCQACWLCMHNVSIQFWLKPSAGMTLNFCMAYWVFSVNSSRSDDISNFTILF